MFTSENESILELPWCVDLTLPGSVFTTLDSSSPSSHTVEVKYWDVSLNQLSLTAHLRIIHVYKHLNPIVIYKLYEYQNDLYASAEIISLRTNEIY